MTISSFRVKRPRPHKLSDPYHDFSPAMLEELLALPDDKLEATHYLWLLDPIMPAGTYEESMYFLPHAFRYLIAHADHDLVASIIGFVSKNTKKLEKDGSLDTVRDCIRECFNHWTSQFIIIHRRSGNDERNRSPRYGDYVKNSEVIWLAVAELVERDQHSDLAESFIQDLADNTSNPLKAAWFLEYASSSAYRVHRPLNNQPITQLINDKERLKKAAELVRQHLVPSERSPTYWRDTFKKLGL